MASDSSLVSIQVNFPVQLNSDVSKTHVTAETQCVLSESQVLPFDSYTRP